MNILIMGCGSIGQRHLSNLIRLGFRSIYVFDISKFSPLAILDDYNYDHVIFFSSFDSIDINPDIVIISTPSKYHVYDIIKVCDRFLPKIILCEKPLAVNRKEIDHLESLSLKNTIITSYNMRFHNGISSIIDYISHGEVGDIIHVEAHSGSYLPLWRPHIDYKNHYAAYKDDGGGCILDCIHEIDIVCRISGRVSSFNAYGMSSKSLGIKTESVVDIMMMHEGGIMSHVGLNYIDHGYRRDIHVIGENGSLRWDWSRKKIEIGKNGSWKVLKYIDDDVNDMYLSMMKHVVSVAYGKCKPFNELAESLSTTRLALSIRDYLYDKGFV